MKPLTHSPHNFTIENTGPDCCPPALWKTSRRRAGWSTPRGFFSGLLHAWVSHHPFWKGWQVRLVQAQTIGYFLDRGLPRQSHGVSSPVLQFLPQTLNPKSILLGKPSGLLRPTNEWFFSMTKKTTWEQCKRDTPFS